MTLTTAAGLFITLSACKAPPNVEHSGGADEEGPAATSRGMNPVYEPSDFLSGLPRQGASFAPDEREILVSLRAATEVRLGTIPISGGQPIPLSDTPGAAISFFPDDDRILFERDRNHSERGDIVIREASGKLHTLVDGGDAKGIFLGFSYSPLAIWLTTNERDPRRFDVYRYSASDYSRERIFADEDGRDWVVRQVSPDGRWLALIRYTGNHSTLHLYDSRTTDGPRDMETDRAGLYDAVAFSPDSSRLYYTTDAHGDFREVWSYELATSRHRREHHADWDITEFVLARDGRYRALVINRDGGSELRVEDARTGQSIPLPGFPSGEVSSPRFSRSGQKLLFYAADSVNPRSLYVFELDTGQIRSLTRRDPRMPPEKHLTRGQVVRYRSFDGREIPALLYRPHTASSASPMPALIWLHGSILGGQSRLSYDGYIQYFVHRGYTVLAINYRGSDGYGKAFRGLDDGRPGQGETRDSVAALDYLKTLPWVDTSSVGILGVSYGGYLSLATMALYPGRFAVGINLWGPVDLLEAFRNMPMWWRVRERMYAECGDPERDAETLVATSPLRHAARIDRPILNIQGGNDPRGMQAQNDELVERLRNAGRVIEYAVIQDQGHGASSITGQSDVIRRVEDFLERYLRRTSSARQAPGQAPGG